MVATTLSLAGRGWAATTIAAHLGVPRTTVRDWLAGRTPGWSLKGVNGLRAPRCEVCGAAEHPFDDLPEAYVYLLGLYLGDGDIGAHARGVFKLRLALDSAYPGIIAEATSAMKAVSPSNRVGQWTRRESGCVDVYTYSRSWPCLFPQHGPGRKHERLIELESWQRRATFSCPHLLVRGLIHSDGCRFQNTGRNGWRHPRYAFSNRSPDIRALFREACDALGLLGCTTTGSVVYVSRKRDVAALDRFVGPKR